jgi:hypothetical protein
MATKIIDERVHNKGSLFRRQQGARNNADLNARELLCALIVESGGGIFMGLQLPEVAGHETLCIFNTHWGASLALNLPDLSSQSVREKLRNAHERFGYTCCR